MEILLLVVLGAAAFWYYRKLNRSNAEVADWAGSFSVYYLAQAMHLRPMQPVPSELMGLLNRPNALDVAQPLLIDLHDYLQERFNRQGHQNDYNLALAETRRLLATELRAAETPLSLQRYVRAMHEKDTDGPIDDATILSDYQALMQALKSDEETRARLIGQVIRENLAHRYQQINGTSIKDYVDRKVANYRLSNT